MYLLQDLPACLGRRLLWVVPGARITLLSVLSCCHLLANITRTSYTSIPQPGRWSLAEKGHLPLC